MSAAPWFCSSGLLALCFSPSGLSFFCHADLSVLFHADRTSYLRGNRSGFSFALDSALKFFEADVTCHRFSMGLLTPPTAILKCRLRKYFLLGRSLGYLAAKQLVLLGDQRFAGFVQVP